MSVIVGEPRIKNITLGDTTPTSWLFDNIGDEVVIEIDWRFQSDFLQQSHDISDSDNTFLVRPPQTITGLLFDTRYLYCSIVGIFEDWDVGDTVTIANDAENDDTKTILEKVSNNLLLMDSAYVSTINQNNALDIGASVYNSTPINGCEFSHNLVENDSPPIFVSAVDGSERKSIRSDIVNTVLTNKVMTPLGHKSYQEGNILIKGNGSGLGPTVVPVAQAFTITQTLIIDPLFLASQIEDIENNIPPSYFKDDACLKYVFKIEASKESNNPNKKKLATIGEIFGNSGWTNENFNGGLTNYFAENVIYRRADNTINTSIELTTAETTVEFDVVNTINAPFSDGNTKFNFLFHILPQPESEYRIPEFATVPSLAKDRTLRENFLIDRAVGTLGALADGRNLGTDIQIVKQLNTTFISADRINCKATFAIAQDSVDKISGMSGQKYRILIATQNHLLDRGVADKVALRIDVDKFFIDTTDLTMVSIGNKFLEHPFSDIDTESKDLLTTARVEDDILAIADFTIDQNGRETDTIILTGASAKLIASDGVNEFTLDEFTTSLTDSKIVSGIPFVDIAEDRGFKTPADENRGTVKLFSNGDAGGIFNYRFQFPFILRWEKWEILPDADDAFFNVAQQNNGLNHNWVHYDVLAGWNIFFRCTINATKNGDPQQYELDSQISTEDYTEGVFWVAENMKTFNNITNDPLLNGAKYGLEAYINSRIEAAMTNIAGSTPSVGDIAIQIRINEFEAGNFKQQFTLSTEYDAHPDTILLSIDSSNRVVIDGTGTPIFIGKCLVDGNALDPTKEYKISDRFWDKRGDIPFPENESKLLEDGSRKLLENDTFKILD